MIRIIVIGAGASGLMAAVSAARCGAQVTVLEGMEKPGRKLLMTGSGRCNLTNTNPLTKAVYQGSNPEFTEEVFRQFTVTDTLSFFHELGVLTKTKNGYVYPYSDQASSVLDAFLLEIKTLKIKLKCSEKVTSITHKDNRFYLTTGGWTYECDKVILSAGSMAAPSTGSDGSGYTLAESLGHRLVSPLPALVPLKIKETAVRRMSGVRMPAALRLEIDGHHAAADQGEVQWTDYGISGIVTFQISSFAVRALHQEQSVNLWVDLLPDFDEEALEQMLLNRISSYPDRTADEFLIGMFPRKAAAFILESSQLKPNMAAGLSSVRSLLDTIKHLKLTVHGHKSYDNAQVCSGGIDTAEISPLTLESKKTKGLFVSGEVMDVDGICGGYNLQWAWSSGYVAGRQAAGEEI